MSRSTALVVVMLVGMLAGCACGTACGSVTVSSAAVLAAQSGCTSFDTLTVTADDIVDMTGMPASFTVKSLVVNSANAIVSLDGLEGMTSLGADASARQIIIQFNPVLADLSAMSGFSTTTYIHLESLPQLTSLDGLDSVVHDPAQSITVEVWDCVKLDDMSALAWSSFGAALSVVDLWQLPLIDDADVVDIEDVDATTSVVLEDMDGVASWMFTNGPVVAIAPFGGYMDMCASMPPAAIGASSLSPAPFVSCPVASYDMATPLSILEQLAPNGVFSVLFDAAPVAGGAIKLTFAPSFTFDDGALAVVEVPGVAPYASVPLSTSYTVSRSGSDVVIHFGSLVPTHYRRWSFSLAGVYGPLVPSAPSVTVALLDAGSVVQQSIGVAATFVVGPPPLVTAINGETSFSALYAGGEVLTLTGTGLGHSLADVANVTLGSALCAPVLSATPSELTCVSPAGLAPGVPVAVNIATTSSAFAPTTSTASFASLEPAAHVTAIDTPLGGGVLALHGGDVVTLTGTAFGTSSANIVSVAIGSTPCTSVTVLDSTSLTCTTGDFYALDAASVAAPASAAVVVVTAASGSVLGSFAPGLVAAFRYPPALVSGLNSGTAASGLLAGGDTLVITGTFLGTGAGDVVSVTVVGVACVPVTWRSAELVECTTGSAPGAREGGVVVVTASSGFANSTSAPGVVFSYGAPSESVEESVSFAVAASSSFALAFYWIIILVVLLFAFSLYKRSKNKKRAAEFSRFRTVSYLEKMFTDHSVLGIAYYDVSHPFTRGSRVLTLILEIQINFLSVLLVTVVAPAVYEDSAASRRLRSETNTSGDWLLALAMGTTLSILVGKPLLQSALEGASATAKPNAACSASPRSIAQAVAAAIDVALLVLNIVLCVDANIVFSSDDSYSVDFTSLLVRFVANMLLSWGLTEPLLVLVKMKVWLDTVIRTSKYAVSNANAKTSNVVKMSTYFTDRLGSDESLADDLVSQPVATASRRSRRRVSPEGSVRPVRHSRRRRRHSSGSSDLLSRSASSSALDDDDDNDNDNSNGGGDATTSTRRSTTSRRERSSSVNSDVVVIADGTDAMAAAAVTPVRTSTRRRASSRSPPQLIADEPVSIDAVDFVAPSIRSPIDRVRGSPSPLANRSGSLNDITSASPSRRFTRNASLSGAASNTSMSSASPSRRRSSRHSTSPSASPVLPPNVVDDSTTTRPSRSSSRPAPLVRAASSRQRAPSDPAIRSPSRRRVSALADAQPLDRSAPVTALRRNSSYVSKPSRRDSSSRSRPTGRQHSPSNNQT